MNKVVKCRAKQVFCLILHTSGQGSRQNSKVWLPNSEKMSRETFEKCHVLFELTPYLRNIFLMFVTAQH
jgi:hypothetical protein